jgi:hypothetical protein
VQQYYGIKRNRISVKKCRFSSMKKFKTTARSETKTFSLLVKIPSHWAIQICNKSYYM